MKCDRCHQNQAAVTLTQTINGVTRDLHLCPACAAELEAQFAKHTWAKLFPDNFFGSWLGHTGGIPDFGGAAQPGLTCPSCGTTFADFLKTGLFGCPDCYRAFAPKLDSLFRRVQGQTRHVGQGLKTAAPAGLAQPAAAAGGKREPQPAAGAGGGGAAKPLDPAGQVTLELQQLKERQRLAVAQEDYESAAQCRDEILQLRQRLEQLQAAGSASPAASEPAAGAAAKQKGENL
ncbi:MAG: UvrB/UvrC motif-containing protein [Oscillospiraceae bacterium]|nr:UvrB/UvrC motif-containing protein [Oscillospiraceae bacterium]MDD4367432.1 UvrB/UvrC motif-containing protein [Oscillospiraceae bacterium]